MRQVYRPVIALIIVLLVAGALRFGFAGVNQFASDEARVSLLALRMARGGEMINFGISSSVGARNLPASVYAFVPPFLLSSDPLIATQYVALLNVIAIGVLFWIVKRTWGVFPALAAGLYLAASPFMVSYARSIWTQNLLMPFTVFWLLAVMTAFTTRHTQLRRFCTGALVLIAGFAVQVHLAGLALCLATLFVLVRFLRRVNWPAVVVGGLLAFMFLVPFLAQAACCNPELIGEYLQNIGNGAGQIDGEISENVLQLAVNTQWDFRMAGSLTDTGTHPLPPLFAGVILLAGFIGLVRKRLEKPAIAQPASNLLVELCICADFIDAGGIYLSQYACAFALCAGGECGAGFAGRGRNFTAHTFADSDVWGGAGGGAGAHLDGAGVAQFEFVK